MIDTVQWLIVIKKKKKDKIPSCNASDKRCEILVVAYQEFNGQDRDSVLLKQRIKKH